MTKEQIMKIMKKMRELEARIQDLECALKAVNDKADATDIEALRVEFLKYNNPADWSQVGNSLPIVGVTYPALAALSSDTVAFIDRGNEELRTYSFNGADWSQVGNSLPIVGVTYPALAALNSNTVVFIDSVNEELRTYSFNGTDWLQVGNSLSIANTAGVHALAALSSNTVAFIDDGNDELRTYEWVNSGCPPTKVERLASKPSKAQELEARIQDLECALKVLTNKTKEK